MKTKITLLLLALLTVIGLSMGTANAYVIATTGPYVLNSTPDLESVLCNDGTGNNIYVQYLNPGQYSNRSCQAINTPNSARFYYKSVATGAYYWTDCGKNLQHDSYSGPYSGWAGFGASVQVLKKVYYPDAPSQNC